VDTYMTSSRPKILKLVQVCFPWSIYSSNLIYFLSSMCMKS
jgi:hypothetical protein